MQGESLAELLLRAAPNHFHWDMIAAYEMGNAVGLSHGELGMLNSALQLADWELVSSGEFLSLRSPTVHQQTSFSHFSISVSACAKVAILQ